MPCLFILGFCFKIGRTPDLGPPVVPFLTPFLGEGSTTKIDYRKKTGAFILSSLLEELAKQVVKPRVKPGVRVVFEDTCFGGGLHENHYRLLIRNKSNPGVGCLRGLRRISMLQIDPKLTLPVLQESSHCARITFLKEHGVRRHHVASVHSFGYIRNLSLESWCSSFFCWGGGEFCCI